MNNKHFRATKNPFKEGYMRNKKSSSGTGFIPKDVKGKKPGFVKKNISQIQNRIRT